MGAGAVQTEGRVSEAKTTNTAMKGNKLRMKEETRDLIGRRWKPTAHILHISEIDSENNPGFDILEKFNVNICGRG